MSHDRKVLTNQLDTLLLSFLAVSPTLPNHNRSQSLF